jgi:hypothetical protein
MVKFGDTQFLRANYNSLSDLAYDRKDLFTTEDCYKQLLEIHIKRGNEKEVAQYSMLLGSVALERSNFIFAEECYKK